MSDYNMNTMMTNREMALAVLALPFQAAARFLRNLGQRTSFVSALSELSNISDAELARSGMTRAEAVQRVLRSRF